MFVLSGVGLGYSCLRLVRTRNLFWCLLNRVLYPKIFYKKNKTKVLGFYNYFLTGQILTREQQKTGRLQIFTTRLVWYRDLKRRDLDKVFCLIEIIIVNKLFTFRVSLRVLLIFKKWKIFPKKFKVCQSRGKVSIWSKDYSFGDKPFQPGV